MAFGCQLMALYAFVGHSPFKIKKSCILVVTGHYMAQNECGDKMIRSNAEPVTSQKFCISGNDFHGLRYQSSNQEKC